MSTRNRIETRTELMARVAEPFGHSKADREDHIALLLVQLQKDITTIRAASIESIACLRSLKGMNNIIGSKARLNDLEQTTNGALTLLAVGCEEILVMTKNKKYTCVAERKFTANEKRVEKRDNQKAIGTATINHVTPPPQLKSKARTQYNVKEVIARRKKIINPVHSKAAQVPTTKPRRRIVSSSAVQDKYQVVITLTNGDSVFISPPETDSDKVMYTLRELLLRLEPYEGKGLKRIVDTLQSTGRCACSSATFFRHLKKYKSDKHILPSADDYGDFMGRPTPIATEDVTFMMNVKQHANLSYIGDGLEEAQSALAAGRKRKAQADGLCPGTLTGFHRTTVAAYDRFATLMDPDISVVPMESARLKSLNREIMSRSVRAWVSCASSAIVSGFK